MDDPSLVSGLRALSASLGLPDPVEDTLEVAYGTRLRYACWRTSAEHRQGSILCLNGRTEFIEKTMEVYAILCRSGFDVWALDWRGQGLSTRALADPDKGHVTDYQHFLDDLQSFVTGVTDLEMAGGKTLMLAHSMGGHIGFRYLHDHPNLFDAAVFSAPMIDIPVNRLPLRWLNALVCGCGFGESYALGTGRFRPLYRNPDDPNDNGDIDDYKALIDRVRDLSSDAEKRMTIERRIRDTPGLALGGPTAAWLNATFRSIGLIWEEGYAETIETPVLMIGGGKDTVVITPRQKAMTERLPNGRFDIIDEGAHELLVECDDVRSAFFEKFAAFAAAFADVTIEQPPVDMRHCVRR